MTSIINKPTPSPMTPVSSPVRVGMIGVGGYGSYRRERLREAGGFELLACCDQNEQALAQACEQEGARAVTNFDALLADPQIEAVIISTGIDTHASFAIQAMQAGKHVFVEKPLCASKAEADELIRVRDETGCVCVVGHTDNDSDPITQLTKSMIISDQLGTVVAYEENASHSGGLWIQPGDWRGQRERNPGGMLMQCGVHALHRFNYLFGPVVNVAAMMRYDAHLDTQTADATNVLLRHASGLVGTLNCYHVTAYCHELRLFGTNGNLYINTHEYQAWFQPSERGGAETREPVVLSRPDAVQRCANLIHWRNAIRKGAPAHPSLEDAVAAVAPVFAAEKAAEKRQEYQVGRCGSVG